LVGRLILNEQLAINCEPDFLPPTRFERLETQREAITR
jgi:hypothetical protein